MENLSLDLFNNNTLPASKLKRVTGGAATGGGSKVVNEGHPSSATVSWGSDTSNGDGSTTYHNYNRANDEVA